MTLRRIACGQLRARELDDAQQALADAVEMVAAAGEAGADLCVLPEGTYPAYVLGSADAARAVLVSGPDPIAVLADAARRAGVEVVVGVVVDTPRGLVNAAVHLGADGRERARVGKRFLWDFDREWYVPGGEPEVVGGVGIMVCADARLPEIAADLVGRGARLLVSSTAWVAPAPPPEGRNPQADFLWRVRALEAGVPGAAATKVGTEGGRAIYSGGSQIVDRRGAVVAMAGPSEPELVVADVEVPERATPPHVDATPTSPAVPPRRPPAYEGSVRVVALTHDDFGDDVARDAHVVVAPRGTTARGLPDGATAEFEGDAMLVAGPARRAATAGAGLIVWRATGVVPRYRDAVETIARARAAENRVFVVVWRDPDEGGPFVVSSAGRVIARSPGPGARHAVAASCLWAEAATKEMAPGTDPWTCIATLGLRG